MSRPFPSSRRVRLKYSVELTNLKEEKSIVSRWGIKRDTFRFGINRHCRRANDCCRNAIDRLRYHKVRVCGKERPGSILYLSTLVMKSMPEQLMLNSQRWLMRYYHLMCKGRLKARKIVGKHHNIRDIQNSHSSPRQPSEASNQESADTLKQVLKCHPVIWMSKEIKRVRILLGRGGWMEQARDSPKKEEGMLMAKT